MNRIKEVLEAKGISQTELASRLGKTFISLLQNANSSNILRNFALACLICGSDLGEKNFAEMKFVDLSKQDQVDVLEVVFH